MKGCYLWLRKLPGTKEKVERQDKLRDWKKLAIRKQLYDELPEKLKAALQGAGQ